MPIIHNAILSFFVLALVISVASCNTSQNVSESNGVRQKGGPCKYQISPFKVEIAEIIITPSGIKDSIRGDKDLHTIYLNYLEGAYQGPQTLNEIYQTDFDSAFVSRNKLVKGTVLTGKAKTITQGTCKPYVVWFDRHFSK